MGGFFKGMYYNTCFSFSDWDYIYVGEVSRQQIL